MPGTMHTEESQIEIPDHFPSLGQSTADVFTEGVGLSARNLDAFQQLTAGAPELKQGGQPRTVPFLAWLATCTQNPFGIGATFTGVFALTVVLIIARSAIVAGTIGVVGIVAIVILLSIPGVLAALAIVRANKSTRLLKDGRLTWGIVTRRFRSRTDFRERDGLRSTKSSGKAPAIVHILEYVYVDEAGHMHRQEDQTRVKGDVDELVKDPFVIVCHDPDAPGTSALPGLLPGKLRMSVEGNVTMTGGRKLAGLLPVIVALALPPVLAFVLTMNAPS